MLGWNTGIQLRGKDGTNRGTKLMRTGRPAMQVAAKGSSAFSEQII
jgi:hypothetical protein